MILVINCGSSSVKFAVMEPLEQVMLVSGLAEKLGSDNAEIAIKIGEEKCTNSAMPRTPKRWPNWLRS